MFNVKLALQWWFVIAAAIIAVLAFYQAVVDENTYQAGLIAMCVAVITFVQAIRIKNPLLAIGGVGGVASGYLWVADGLGVPPSDPFLFILLAALAVVALFGTIWVWFFFTKT